MKPLSEQDHYELLEVTRDATPEEIERAYRLALVTFGDGSLAGYSVLGEGEAAVMRERIEAAYRVLSDEWERAAYLASLGAREAQWLPAPPLPSESPPPRAPEPLSPLEAFEEDESDDYDGARLRRVRMGRGLELQDVTTITKINPTYLRFLEEERFDELPARVYVRGFVAAYAHCVGLDAKPVAASYMKRFDAGRGSRRRGRFFGGDS